MSLKKSVFLAVFSLLLYSNTLFNGFMSDDYALLGDRNLTPAGMAQVFSPSYWEGIPAAARGRFRPVRTLSLLADRALYGQAPRGYHLTNALLNSAAVVAAGYFGGLVFPAGTCFYGALVFAAYPVHSEAVAWVKNRSDLLCAVFYFLALIFFVLFARGKGLAAALAAAGFCSLSVLSKETGGTAPLAALAVTVFFFSGEERRRGFLLSGLLLAFTAGWFVSKEFWWKGELLAAGGAADAYTQLRMVLYTTGKYLGLLFFPFRLSAEHGFDLMKGPPVSSLLALAGFLGLGGLAWARKDRELGFSLVWVVILLLPVANIVYLESRPLAEQRLYLPAAGFAWLGALAFHRLRGRKYAGPLAAVLLLGLSSAAFSRNFVWKNDLTFWSDAVRKNPGNYRANYNLAAEYQRRGLFQEAIGHYRTASLDADLPEIYYGLAFCYDKVGEYPLSLENYAMAARLAQKPSPDLYNNMGIVYEKTGNLKKAEALYRMALAADPAYGPAAKNLEGLWKKK